MKLLNAPAKLKQIINQKEYGKNITKLMAFEVEWSISKFNTTFSTWK